MFCLFYFFNSMKASSLAHQNHFLLCYRVDSVYFYHYHEVILIDTPGSICSHCFLCCKAYLFIFRIRITMKYSLWHTRYQYTISILKLSWSQSLWHLITIISDLELPWSQVQWHAIISTHCLVHYTVNLVQSYNQVSILLL